MSGTILLADDSLTIQKVVELTFADTEFRVVAVSSGDELLERLRDSQPDLVICDVIMPGTDGYEVCQQIKSSPDWLHLPVILLTGTFEPFDRDRAIAAGCSEIITKPFEARKLVDTVERLIGGSDVQAPSPGPATAAPEESWPDAATPVDITEAPDADDFGTRLSAATPEPVEDDGIEFTTSGFAEMEAAAEKPPEPAQPVAAIDGIDFEFGAAESEAEVEDVSAQTVKIDLSSISPESLVEPQEEALATAAEDAPTIDDDPPTVEPVQPPPPEPETPAPDDDEPAAAPVFEDEPSMADTSPVEPPEEADQPEAATAPITTSSSPLSDEEIDRIARRVVELASDRLEQIAWEVVPDMAEIVVRQRIRELEAEAETAAAEPVQ